MGVERTGRSAIVGAGRDFRSSDTSVGLLRNGGKHVQACPGIGRRQRRAVGGAESEDEDSSDRGHGAAESGDRRDWRGGEHHAQYAASVV